MIRKQHTHQQTLINHTPEGGTPMNRDQQPTYRNAVARWRTSGRARMFRVFAIGLLACASLLGASANSSHQARAAAHTAAATTFQVSSVTAWVNNGAVNGQCSPSVPFTFLGIITFPAGNPGGTLYYFWARDSLMGGDQPQQTVTIQPGQPELKVYDTYNVSAGYGNGQLIYDRLLTYLDPTTYTPSWESLPVNISLVCAFDVTSVTGSVSPITWCPSWRQVLSNTPLTLTFSYTINVSPSPGGPVTYQIARTVPGGSPQLQPPVTVHSGTPVSDPWTIHADDAPGSYTETLTINSPISYAFPVSVTFTKTC